MNQTKKKSPSAKPGAEPLARFWGAKLRSPRLISLALGLATALVYLPVGWYEFVNYDDGDYVTSNSHVQEGLNWQSLRWAFSTGHSSNWHPLAWISHMVDWQMFGHAAAGPHLVNAALHVINTLLLFGLLNFLTKALWRSALVAALFGLHPLHVESVAWISERKDVLSTLFFLATLWAYGAYAKALLNETSGVAVQARVPRLMSSAARCFSVALAFFALGLMCKPMLVTLPFVLLLIDYWPLGRIDDATTDNRQRGRQCLLLVVEKLPFLALSAISSYVTFRVQLHGGAVSTSISLGTRLANALVSYVRYLSKTFWPAKLSVLYPHPGDWPLWETLGCGALLLSIFALVVTLGRRRPYLVVGWLWFFGTLIPVVGLIQVGVQSMADRYTYVPIIGLFLMIVWATGDWVLRKRSGIPASAASKSAKGGWDFGGGRELAACGFVAGASLLACAVLTSRQLTFWRNSEALFRHAVRVTKNNYLAYNNLGLFLAKEGKSDEAMEKYQESLRINPQYEDALNNLGYALAGAKKYTEAVSYYMAALRARPGQVEVHNNLGNALSELGRTEEAIEHYRFVLAQKPDHADAHNNLGIALAMRGHLDEAIGHFREAIRCRPAYASAHSNLGNALAVEHKLDAAIKEYQEALRLRPDDAQAHNNLGNAMAEQGLLDEGIFHYEQALKLNSDNPEAHFNLGMALARQGKRQQARDHYVEALRLKPDYIEARKQLARETRKTTEP